MAKQNYVLLNRITLGSNASSIKFDSIPPTGYTDLKIAISALNTTGLSNTIVKFNNSSTGYTFKALRGTGTAAASFTQATWGNGTYFQAGYNRNGSSPSNSELYIPNYTSSNNKSISLDYVEEINGNPGYSFLTAGLWSNPAAITSIEFSCDTGAFAAGSSFSLYGIANSATTPLSSPKAFGGDIIKTDGTYWYHAFLSSGSFTPQLSLTTDCLIVAGGGGGGTGYYSGGGGAGGLLPLFNQQVAASTTYAVVVGAGGAAATQGGNSQIGSLTAAIGGGRGRNYQEGVGGNGGSGGGSGGGSQLQSTPTAGQGNAGGKGDPIGGSNVGAGGGGGGAGSAGGNGGNLIGGNGGSGSSAYSSWGLATGTGNNSSGTYFFAGGGGGGAGTGNNGNDTNGKGSNGGGNGGGHTNGAYGPTAGAVNTGGGGGGGSESGAVGIGAAGGSGIVIIRYLV